MSTINIIPLSEFQPVFDHGWEPVVLQGYAIPSPLRGIPRDLGWGIIASGEVQAIGPYSSRKIRNGRLVGGIDVYRYAPDDPVRLNKDWYAVVASDGHPDSLFVEGPFNDSEHWIDEVPERYSGIRVVVL